MIKETECKICGVNSNNKIHKPKEMMLGLRDEHIYFECNHCGCLQINVVPDNLQDYYPDNYYSYERAESVNPILKKISALRDYFAVTRESLIGRILYSFFPRPGLLSLQHLNLNKSSRIMDVGCGTGKLLHALKEIGFSHLLGVDPFIQNDIEYENGLRIEKKLIQEVSGEWDLIRFSHSFEHIFEQHTVLKKVHELLSPSGTCLIGIPTVSSYAWNHYGLDWIQLDAPRHLFLHSVESMRQLAEKNGLKLDKVVYDSGILQFWGSEQYKKDIPLMDEQSYIENKKTSPFSAKEIREFSKRAKTLNDNNQGDQALFYLSKMS